MKQVERKELIKSIEEYLNSSPERPLLLWCATTDDIDAARGTIGELEGCSKFDTKPLYGHKHFFTKDGVYEKISDHPELLTEFFYPNNYKGGARFFMYFRFVGALEAPLMQYVKDLMKESKRPVVCVVDEREKKYNSTFDASDFEEWKYINQK